MRATPALNGLKESRDLQIFISWGTIDQILSAKK